MENHNSCTCDDCITEQPKEGNEKKFKCDLKKERLQKNKNQRKARRQQRRKK